MRKNIKFKMDACVANLNYINSKRDNNQISDDDYRTAYANLKDSYDTLEIELEKLK